MILAQINRHQKYLKKEDFIKIIRKDLLEEFIIGMITSKIYLNYQIDKAHKQVK